MQKKSPLTFFFDFMIWNSLPLVPSHFFSSIFLRDKKVFFPVFFLICENSLPKVVWAGNGRLKGKVRWKKREKLRIKIFFFTFHHHWQRLKLFLSLLQSFQIICRAHARTFVWKICSNFFLPNFGNFLKLSSGIKGWNLKIKVWERLEKVSKGGHRQGWGREW